LYISLGSGISTTYNNARLAALETEGLYVINSGNLSTGMGLVVIAAAERIAAGLPIEQIVEEVTALTKKVDASFVLDTLDYMKKGGRCSAVTALGANLLKLHPCIEVQNGKMGVVKKYRGSIERVVETYVRERLADRKDIDTKRVFLVDTCPDSALRDIARKVLEEDGRFAEIVEAKAGCTIFSHCGPGTLGVLFFRT
jgi:DegV family protein with EDD domain